MVKPAFPLNNAYKSIVEKQAKKLSLHEDEIITELKSPFIGIEFYHVILPACKINRGLICAINDEIEVWSNDHKALLTIFNYILSKFDNDSLTESQLIFLFNLYLKKQKQFIITDENKAPLEKMARKCNINLQVPKRNIEAESILYTFWSYTFDQSSFSYYEIILKEKTVYQVIENGQILYQ